MSVDIVEHDSGSEPGHARRRIIALPQRTEVPVALIARDADGSADIERAVRSVRSVIVFPSLSHFCIEQTRKERWSAVVVARTCAWDARLDQYVDHRGLIALYNLTDEGYGWPESVVRVQSAEALEAWLNDPPAPPRPAPKERSARTRMRQLASRELTGTVASPVSSGPSNSAQPSAAASEALDKVVAASGANEASTAPGVASSAWQQLALEAGSGASEPTTAPKPTSARKGLARLSTRLSPPARREAAPAEPTRHGAERVRAGKSRNGHVRLAEPAASTVRGERGRRSAADRASRLSQRSAFATSGIRPGASDEAKLMSLAVEIGLDRATALLVMLRARARQVLT